jgi:hypothetical protein
MTATRDGNTLFKVSYYPNCKSNQLESITMF